MMRNKASSSMQKTYDDCYLICSTAVYFEGQHNETEALRSWRNALDQIYYHNAYRVPSSYRPRSETERALQESLRQMELQCKERVDLLEALKKSREETDEDSSKDSASQPKGSTNTLPPKEPAERHISGTLGDSNIPTVDYSSIVRPAPLPVRPAPKRPSYTSKKSSNVELPRAGVSSPQPPSGGWLSPPPNSLGPPEVDSNRKGSRTPSPEKKGGMLRTLRAGGKERSSSGKLPSSLRRPPAASKAATQAWGIPQRPSLGNLEQGNGDSNGNSSPALGITWDPYTRSLSDRPPSRDTQTNRHSNDIEPPFGYSPDTPPSSRPTNYASEPNHQRDYPLPYPDDTEPRATHSRQGSLDVPEDHPLPPLPMPDHPNPNTSAAAPSRTTNPRPLSPPRLPKPEVPSMPSYRKEYLPPRPSKYKQPPNATPPRRLDNNGALEPAQPHGRTLPAGSRTNRPGQPPPIPRKAAGVVAATLERQKLDDMQGVPVLSAEESSSGVEATPRRRRPKDKEATPAVKPKSKTSISPEDSDSDPSHSSESASTPWQKRIESIMKHLPKGVDPAAAKQIFNEIVIQGDEVHWDDVAGLEIAKTSLKETVVYPFLRPDLFMGLREPARGMLLFGPPGTGKTMLARAVATESRSTFFAISASSLTSKFLGESEKLVRALFALAKVLAPSIIFVDEIDSLLSARGGGSEHEATRRIKTEFLIQWSDLAKAAAGRETSERDKERGDATRVLVLAATNLPWAIDEAARRRFVRRQYIPLPEDWVRKKQLGTLLSHQKHSLGEIDLDRLVALTDGFSGSDITALAKDAAMGPLRSLGEKLLHMSPEDIRPIQYSDFESSLVNIRPSVSKSGLEEFEQWARDFGERGG